MRNVEPRISKLEELIGAKDKLPDSPFIILDIGKEYEKAKKRFDALSEDAKDSACLAYYKRTGLCVATPQELLDEVLSPYP